MWIIIILIVAFIIGKFLYDTNKQADTVAKQGGMRTKYRTLINHFLSSAPQTRIFDEGAAFITIGVSNIGGTTTFDIQQTYGRVTIRWKVNSPVFGKHNLEWSFNEFEDQDKIIGKIENDLSKYQANVMQNYM